jgi:hypothetical protein
MSLKPIREDDFDDGFDDDIVTNRYGCAMSFLILAVGYPVSIILSPILIPLCMFGLFARVAVRLWQKARGNGPGFRRRALHWLWRKIRRPS